MEACASTRRHIQVTSKPAVIPQPAIVLCVQPEIGFVSGSGMAPRTQQSHQTGARVPGLVWLRCSQTPPGWFSTLRCARPRMQARDGNAANQARQKAFQKVIFKAMPVQFQHSVLSSQDEPKPGWTRCRRGSRNASTKVRYHSK